MDVDNRDELERRMARLVSRQLRGQLSDLIEALGDPPSLSNLPNNYWQNVDDEFARAVLPVLLYVYLSQAQAVSETSAVGIDWGLINDRAVTWAREYAYELVRGLNATTRKTLRRVIGNFFEGGVTMGELRAQLEHSFGPVRAATIAQTEVTRAAVMGERAFEQELNALGLQTTGVWNTNADERVCPICSPLDGVKRNADGKYDHPSAGTYDHPPAHPRCRCWENIEVIE